jgi:hypothetical protein
MVLSRVRQKSIKCPGEFKYKGYARRLEKYSLIPILQQRIFTPTQQQSMNLKSLMNFAQKSVGASKQKDFLAI